MAQHHHVSGTHCDVCGGKGCTMQSNRLMPSPPHQSGCELRALPKAKGAAGVPAPRFARHIAGCRTVTVLGGASLMFPRWFVGIGTEGSLVHTGAREDKGSTPDCLWQSL